MSAIEDPGPPERIRANLPLPHVRLMPTAIVVMGVVLGLKAVDLGREAGLLGERTPVASQVVVGIAQAQAPAPVARESPEESEARPRPTVAETLPASPAELAVLENLRARRLQIEERERSAAEREAVLTAAERRLSARVDELTQLQARLETMEAARKKSEDAGWAGLVRIYETMKPRDAARIFDEMEMPVLVEVLDRMRERPASAVLASMAPEKARLLTAEIAQRRARPGQSAPAQPASTPTPPPAANPLPQPGRT